MILLLDNFDSFTYNLVDYFEQLGVTCTVLRNDIPLKEVISKNYSGIVLSPGPAKPENSGNLLKVIEHYHNKLPLLGICLGHQAIGQYFGACLQKALRPMHGKISEIDIEPDPLFKGLPTTFDVVRYHSLVLTFNDDTYLRPLAMSREAELMAMRHNDLPIWGLQFHPEAALTENGLAILRNWLLVTEQIRYLK
ncbi:MAG: aminodeoxychorismate/anthranilate synthase component II [Bacteroidota bacterium]